LHISKPSTSGSIKSSTTSDGGSDSRDLRKLDPLRNPRTLKRSFLRWTEMSSMMSSSSSTTATCLFIGETSLEAGMNKRLYEAVIKETCRNGKDYVNSPLPLCYCRPCVQPFRP